MYKIAVLGDPDSVLGFKALGLDVFVADHTEEARRILRQLAKGSYAVIYITEQLAADMGADIDRYKDQVTPAVILIPGKSGSLGLGQTALQSAIERAVGADIA